MIFNGYTSLIIHSWGNKMKKCKDNEMAEKKKSMKKMPKKSMGKMEKVGMPKQELKMAKKGNKK